MRSRISLFGRSVALLLAIIVTVSLFSCDRAEPRERYFFPYFDTQPTLTDYSGGSETDFVRRAGRVDGIFEYYHRLFDIYNEYDGISNVATLNRLAGEGPVGVERELIDFLLFCKEMHETTDGAVNVAMGAVLRIWHEHRTAEGEKTLPDADTLRAAGEHCDIDCLIIDEAALTVEFSDPLMSLDVGAVAKGYAVERAAEYLISDGADGYVLNVGGNLRAIGKKPDGTAWKSYIRNPDIYDTENRYVYSFFLSDGSAVTSGDYERFFVVDGVRYHHIIDGKTLMPAAYFSSVTVLCRDSGMADALSTALFNMDYESGKALVSSLDGVRAVWITKTGEILE